MLLFLCCCFCVVVSLHCTAWLCTTRGGAAGLRGFATQRGAGRYTAATNPDRHLHAAAVLGADVSRVKAEDAGRVLADTILKYMHRLKVQSVLQSLLVPGVRACGCGAGTPARPPPSAVFACMCRRQTPSPAVVCMCRAGVWGRGGSLDVGARTLRSDGATPAVVARWLRDGCAVAARVCACATGRGARAARSMSRTASAFDHSHLVRFACVCTCPLPPVPMQVPNGLTALGYSDKDVSAMVAGTLPQKRCVVALCDRCRSLLTTAFFPTRTIVLSPTFTPPPRVVLGLAACAASLRWLR